MPDKETGGDKEIGGVTMKKLLILALVAVTALYAIGKMAKD